MTSLDSYVAKIRMVVGPGEARAQVEKRKKNPKASKVVTELMEENLEASPRTHFR